MINYQSCLTTILGLNLTLLFNKYNINIIFIGYYNMSCRLILLISSHDSQNRDIKY